MGFTTLLCDTKSALLVVFATTTVLLLYDRVMSGLDILPATVVVEEGLGVRSSATALANDHSVSDFQPRSYPWEADYVAWRKRDKVSLEEWTAAFPTPQPMKNAYEDRAACVDGFATRLQQHVMEYRSPRLADVTAAVRAELDRRKLQTVLVLYWGRDIYADLVWGYVERNLRSNQGILDKVCACCTPRPPPSSTQATGVHVFTPPVCCVFFATGARLSSCTQMAATSGREILWSSC